MSYNATTFYDRDRKLQGVFAAARDVTERSRFEMQMREQAAKLSDLHRRKDEFLAMLSREATYSQSREASESEDEGGIPKGEKIH